VTKRGHPEHDAQGFPCDATEPKCDVCGDESVTKWGDVCEHCRKLEEDERRNLGKTMGETE